MLPLFFFYTTLLLCVSLCILFRLELEKNYFWITIIKVSFVSPVVPSDIQMTLSNYKSTVIPSSFKDLRNRPYPIDPDELPTGTSDGVGLRAVQKYFSTHSNKSIGSLVRMLAKIFYTPPKKNHNTKPKAHRLFYEALSQPINHPSLLLSLQRAYIALTHCPQDVDSFVHPKEICNLFGNTLWQAVFAVNHHITFNLVNWNAINSHIKCFRFPNNKTLPEILFSSLLLILPNYDVTELDDEYKKKLMAVLKLVPASKSILRKEGIVEVDDVKNANVSLSQLKSAYTNLQVKNAADFLSSELDLQLPIPEEAFAGPSELLPAWNLVKKVQSNQTKSTKKRAARSGITPAEDEFITKKVVKRSKTKGPSPPPSPNNTHSITSVNQTGGKYSVSSCLLYN